MIQFDSNRVCESTTLNTSENEVFVIQNTYAPVITDQDVLILFLD
jgi:hypothetical protein